jgi:hypothetical protein
MELREMARTFSTVKHRAWKDSVTVSHLTDDPEEAILTVWLVVMLILLVCFLSSGVHFHVF